MVTKIHNYLSMPYTQGSFTTKRFIELHKAIKETYKIFIKQEATNENLTQFKNRLMQQMAILVSLDPINDEDLDVKTELYSIIEEDLTVINDRIAKLQTKQAEFDDSCFDAFSTVGNQAYIDRMEEKALACNDPYSMEGVMLSKRWRYKLMDHTWFHFCNQMGSNYAKLIQYEYLYIQCELYNCGAITKDEFQDRTFNIHYKCACVFRDVFEKPRQFKPGCCPVKPLDADEIRNLNEKYDFDFHYVDQNKLKKVV